MKFCALITTLFLSLHSMACFTEMTERIDTAKVRAITYRDSPTIYVHPDAREYLDGSVRANTEFGGITSGPRGDWVRNFAWLRDYFPISVYDQQSKEPKLLTYLSFKTYDGDYYRANDSSLSYPHPNKPGYYSYTKSEINSPRNWIKVEDVPLILEGGSVLAVGDTLFISSKVLFENSRSISEWQQHLMAQGYPQIEVQEMMKKLRSMKSKGYQKRDHQQIIATLAHASGMRVEVIDWPPGVKSGHLDMIMANGGKNKVYLAQFDDIQIQNLGYEHERQFHFAYQEYLNQLAQSLKQKVPGLVVERFPMPPARNLTPSDLSPFDHDAKFLSTVNFFINDGTAFVPDFKTLSDAQRDTIGEIFKKRQIETVFVNAEKLIQSEGFFRCLTAEILLP